MYKPSCALDRLLAKAIARAFLGLDYSAEMSLSRDLAKLLEKGGVT